MILTISFIMAEPGYSQCRLLEIWAVKTDKTMYHFDDEVYIDYLDQVVFQKQQGLATEVALGNFGEDAWHVGLSGNGLRARTLWRLEERPGKTPGWVNHNIKINGMNIPAYDIGARYDYNTDTSEVWAVGQASKLFGKSSTVYRFSNGAWTGVGGVSASRIAVGNTAWYINSSGDVWQYVKSTGWVRRGYGSQQKAVDIGCGADTYIATDKGKLLRYNGGTSWVSVPEFTQTQKLAKRVDAFAATVAVVTTLGEIYLLEEARWAGGGWVRKIPTISNVNDVALAVDYPLGKAASR
jgi:hypothetical protein